MGKRVLVRTKAKLLEAASVHMTMLEQIPERDQAISRTGGFGMPLNTSQGRSNRKKYFAITFFMLGSDVSQ